MVLKRIIPILQLKDDVLVKTTNYKNPQYIGDPVNTLRIFNELEVDEIAIVDIRASMEGKSPNLELLKTFCDECFMPLAYGGGITSVDQGSRILAMGYEKLILNTSAVNNPKLITELASEFGSQAIVVSIDLKSTGFFKKKKTPFIVSATQKCESEIIEFAKTCTDLGAGELLINDVDREGTWKGVDLSLIQEILDHIDLPVIFNGGAATVADINKTLSHKKINAIGLGNMVVYQGKDLGVLVNFPDKSKFKGWE